MLKLHVKSGKGSTLTVECPECNCDIILDCEASCSPNSGIKFGHDGIISPSYIVCMNRNEDDFCDWAGEAKLDY